MDMKLLLEKIDEKMNKQTTAITNAVTKNVMEALDEKMKYLMEENKTLKTKVDKLEEKICFMEKERRKNNIVIFGVEELEKNEWELVDRVKEIIEETGVNLESQEINKAYRIGVKSDKMRPVVVCVTTRWKKHLIMKNKRNLPTGVNIKDDLPKEVQLIRKKLQPKLEEERKKGNIAYIKYDQLIVKKPHDNICEKRKREISDPPKSPNSQTTREDFRTGESKRVNRASLANYLSRPRSQSTTELMPKN